MIQAIVVPDAHRLSDSSPIGLRDRVRPPEHQQPDYDADYDFRTLWYDIFPISGGKMVMLQAPPAVNLSRWFAGLEVKTRKGPALKVGTVPMDRNLAVLVDARGASVSELTFAGPGMTVVTRVAPSHTSWFRGRRVLLTKSQDNPLEWIRDWAQFYVTRHRADAVLLYDHGSTRYSREQLLETLASVPGLQTAVVVDWDFPFGPNGHASKLWDSDFCQYGILEHAKWRFLSEARCVLNCDIDELALAPAGKTVFEICELCPSGYLQIPAFWAYWHNERKLDIAGTGRVRHADHRLRKKGGEAPCFNKWAVCPARLGPAAQWAVHAVYQTQPFGINGMSLRHCHSLTRLSYKSARASGLIADPAAYERDDPFCSALDAVFAPEGHALALAETVGSSP